MGKNAEKPSKFRCSSRKNGETVFKNRNPHIDFNVEGSTVLKVIGSNYAVDFRGENSDLVSREPFLSSQFLYPIR